MVLLTVSSEKGFRICSKIRRNIDMSAQTSFLSSLLDDSTWHWQLSGRLDTINDRVAYRCSSNFDASLTTPSLCWKSVSLETTATSHESIRWSWSTMIKSLIIVLSVLYVRHVVNLWNTHPLSRESTFFSFEHPRGTVLQNTASICCQTIQSKFIKTNADREDSRRMLRITRRFPLWQKDSRLLRGESYTSDVDATLSNPFDRQTTNESEELIPLQRQLRSINISGVDDSRISHSEWSTSGFSSFALNLVTTDQLSLWRDTCEDAKKSKIGNDDAVTSPSKSFNLLNPHHVNSSCSVQIS